MPRPDMVAFEAETSVSRGAGGGAGRRPQPRARLRGQRRRRGRHRLRQGPHPGRARRPRGDPVARATSRPAHFVPETKRLTGLLREMQERNVPPGDRRRRVRRHGRAGHPRGPDRGARGRDRRRVRRGGAGRSSACADGSVVVDRADGRRRASTSCSTPTLPQGAWDTVGGLVLDLAGHVPAEGEAVEVDGFRLVAERVHGPPHRPGAHRPHRPRSAPSGPADGD